MKGLYSPEDKRFKSLNDVWDLCRFKLMVFVVEAKELPNVSAKSQLTCSVRLERRVFGKTGVQVAAEPKWASLFWTAFDDLEIKTLVLEVFDKKTILGEVRVALNKAPKDSLVDAWIPLKPPSEGKKKGPKDVAMAGGHLHVRYILSAMPETRPAKPADMVPQEYFYRKNNLMFRAGDLIAYSGTGLLQTVQKVIANSEHSHVGLVVALPNKWTSEEELFVLELTFNLDNVVDAFAETARKGMCLFRLKERLHNFQGGLITHYPLAKPLEAIPKTDLGQTVLRIHGQETVPSIPNSAGTQYILRTFPFDTKRNLREFVPLTGVKFIAQALAHIAVLKEDTFPTPTEQTVEWLKRQPIWDRPNLVRMPQEALKTVMATMGRNTAKKAMEHNVSVQHNFPVVAPPQFAPQQGLPAVAPSMPMHPHLSGQFPVQQQQPLQPFAPQYPMAAAPQMNFPVVAPPNFGPQVAAGGSNSRRASGVMAPVGAAGGDPKLAAMEAEMRRLELEAAAQQRMMDEQARKLEAEQKALEAAMMASEAQMKQLQAGLASGGDDANSDEGDDDGSTSANAQLLALSSAGFNYSYP